MYSYHSNIFRSAPKHGGAVNNVSHHSQEGDADSYRVVSNLTMPPGTLLGMGDYYGRSPRVIARSYLVSSVSLFL
jgi:hypothetical protein